MRKIYQLPTADVITITSETMLASSAGDIVIGGDNDRIDGGESGQLTNKQNNDWDNIWK